MGTGPERLGVHLKEPIIPGGVNKIQRELTVTAWSGSSQGVSFLKMLKSIIPAEQTSGVVIPSPIAAPASVSGERIVAIDHLRGIAMLLMAVDHSMYFAGVAPVAESYGMKLPELGSLSLVLIGLATNISSGVFFALAGTSVAFFAKSRLNRGWTQGRISRFLVIRGVLLIALDAIVEPLGWGAPLTVDTLSALGFCIIVLAFVRRLPLCIISISSILLFVLYPILVTSIKPSETTTLEFILTVLFQFHMGGPLYVEFPLLARLSVVFAGFTFGILLQQNRISISSSYVWIGLAGLAVTFLLRLGGGYGNFVPYNSDLSAIYFLIENKQPPSIVFLLFNLSLAVLLLAGLNRFQRSLDRTGIAAVLQLFGQTSLFFFVAQLLVYGKITRSITHFKYFTDIRLVAVTEFTAGLVILIPLCMLYRWLRNRYPNGLLQYF